MIPVDYQTKENSQSPPTSRGENIRVVYVPQSFQPQAAQQAHQQQQLALDLQRQQHIQQQQMTVNQQQQLQQHHHMRQMQQMQLQQQQLQQLHHQQQQQQQIPPGHLPPSYQVQVLYHYGPLPPGQPQVAEGFWSFNPVSALLKKPPTPPIVPHDNDVLMGRGGKNNLHVGNEKLRKMARAVREEYIKSSKKEKSALSRKLVQDVLAMDPPGRFLRRNRITSSWETVDIEYAREKASQCLRDAVTGGPVNGKDEGECDSDSERPSTPVTSNHSGQKREDSPVITPESSPKTKKRMTVKAGDIPTSLSLEPTSLSQKENRAASPTRSISPRPTSSSADLNALARTENSDSAAIDAFMSMQSSAMEPLPYDSQVAADTKLSPPRHNAIGVVKKSDDDGLDVSGHSIACSETNFGRFAGDFLGEDNDNQNSDEAPRKLQGSYSALHNVNDAFMAQNDEPIDLEACCHADNQEGDKDEARTADYAPMATEEDSPLEVCIESDTTRQTEEMLAMLTDPFGSDFY